jgi:hypothetical protein
VNLNWAEPGDPKINDFSPKGEPPRCRHLGAPRPDEKPKSYPSLSPELEIELIRRYRDDGDLDALEHLCGAHRRMVVAMAQRKFRGRLKLKMLIEYGMLGVRIPAEPLRPSKTKKGVMVGFDPAKGYCFNTIARHYAKNEMNRALNDLRPPQNLQDTKKEFDAWAKTPIPEHTLEATKDIPDEDHDCPSAGLVAGYEMLGVASHYRFVGYVLETIRGQRRRGHHRTIISSRQQHRPIEPADTCFVDCTHRPGIFGASFPLWNCADLIAPTLVINATRQGFLLARTVDYEKPTRATTKRKTKWSREETEARIKYVASHQAKLDSFVEVGRAGMEGWAEDGAGADEGGYVDIEEYMWEPSSAALSKKKYRLPENILRQRWRIAKKRHGKKLPFLKKDGLGLYDRYGNYLPQFAITTDKITIVKCRNAQFLKKFPLASIYLVGVEETGVHGEVTSYRRFRRKARINYRKPKGTDKWQLT